MERRSLIRWGVLVSTDVIKVLRTCYLFVLETEWGVEERAYVPVRMELDRVLHHFRMIPHPLF